MSDMPALGPEDKAAAVLDIKANLLLLCSDFREYLLDYKGQDRDDLLIRLDVVQERIRQLH